MAKLSVAMLVCSDLLKSRDFYRDIVGLKLKRDSAPDRVEFDLGSGMALVLHPKSKLLAVRPGSLQLGFSVESVDSFVSDCTQMKVPVFQDPYDETWGRVAVIGDPDGYPIQVSSPRKRSRV
jgi:catechol 2,3-dioxygenase-like lactoylglutathione lyase family enzyme